MALELMKEIASWKLEAKLEDTARYFYHTRDIESLDSGDKCYVTGRKGTGKTAIGEFLVQREAPKCFAERLSFKNFPFNELYRLSNDRYTPPNQYITLWKWIIYCYVARLMIRNESLDANVRSKLSGIFPTRPLETLSRSITHLTSPEVRLSFLGLELLASAKRTDRADTTTWIDRVDLLEEVIATYSGDASYTIVFDELDEDYKYATDPAALTQYLQLLTGLVKAVQDIKATFPARRYGLRPIVFVRNDIYDRIQDPDKTKWNDLRLELRWDLDSIRNLMSFRIGRAQKPDCDPIGWDRAITIAFSGWNEMKELRKASSLIDWLSKLTLYRPRDYISFLQIAADRSLQRRIAFIDPHALRKARQPYSEYLRSDIQDEMATALPEIDKVLNVIARIRKPSFPYNAFATAYGAAASEEPTLTRSPKDVMRALFRFGIIANQTAIGGQISGLTGTGLDFDPSLSVVVFRGLLLALQIPE
jgi:hypothetical protein